MSIGCSDLRKYFKYKSISIFIKYTFSEIPATIYPRRFTGHLCLLLKRVFSLMPYPSSLRRPLHVCSPRVKYCLCGF